MDLIKADKFASFLLESLGESGINDVNFKAFIVRAYEMGYNDAKSGVQQLNMKFGQLGSAKAYDLKTKKEKLGVE